MDVEFVYDYRSPCAYLAAREPGFISAKVLWPLLPEGWEISPAAPIGGAGELPLPSHVLEHRAVLTLPDGTPFSELVETYTGNVLAFPIQR